MRGHLGAYDYTCNIYMLAVCISYLPCVSFKLHRDAIYYSKCDSTLLQIKQNTGVIKEVAETQCGSMEKLAQALARGAVIKGDEEEPLYYFRSAQVGEEESYDTIQKLSRKKATTMDVFDTYKEMINGLGWKLNCKQSDMEAFISEVCTLIKF